MMRKILIFFFLLSACGPAADQNSELQSSRRNGSLEGYAAVNKLLQSRLLQRDQNFAIEAIGGPGIYAVRMLLGYYDNSGEVSNFRSGEPNPFNSMLWYNQLARLAQALGQSCPQDTIIFEDDQGVSTYRLRAELAAILSRLCPWPQESGDAKSQLQSLWLLVMSYDAPQQERDAWLQFFLDSGVVFPSDSARMAALFETMFMNPYFLLQE